MDELFGADFKYFPYHVERENLASISYMCESKAKVWYVFNRSERDGLKRSLASYILFPKYLDDHQRDARQITAINSKVSDPKYLLSLKCRVEVSHYIQQKRHLVSLAPCAYHGGLESVYNVAIATNVSYL